MVSHQAVLRCILSYFYDRPYDELPYIDIPLHTLVKLTPRAYHCDSTIYKYNLEKDEVVLVNLFSERVIFSGVRKRNNSLCR